MNYLLVNGATEINQKWGAAESMGQWKHSSQEERSDAGEERRFKAVCLINLHAAPIQRSGRAVGLFSRKVFYDWPQLVPMLLISITANDCV